MSPALATSPNIRLAILGLRLPNKKGTNLKTKVYTTNLPYNHLFITLFFYFINLHLYL